VEESLQAAIGLAYDEDRLAGNIAHHMVAGRSEFPRVRRQLPGRAEDFAPFEFQPLLVGVKAGMQRVGAVQRFDTEMLLRGHVCSAARKIHSLTNCSALEERGCK